MRREEKRQMGKMREGKKKGVGKKQQRGNECERVEHLSVSE